MGSKAHVMVIAYPVQGHINPMLQFSKRLASKGLIVTFITTTHMGNTAIPAKSTSIRIQCIYDGFQAGEKAGSIEAFQERFKPAVTQSLAQLISEEKNSKYPPKVLIYDSFMPWALGIAESQGLLGASFYTQSCSNSAVYYHLHEGNFKVPLEGDSISLPSMPLLGTNDLPSFVSDHNSYPAMLGLVLDRFSNFRKANWLFFNTFDKLEEEIVKWMASQSWPIKTIGPTIPSMYLDKRLEDDKDYGLSLFKPSAETCMQWLDTKQKASVVYASFGSLASLGEGQMKEIAWGLKYSNCYFLWVVRESEQSKLPSSFVEETSEKGLIVNWSPQLDVLGHPAVGCFMTHCGWNSTTEALSLGVPMVAMPQWTDQPTNAKCLVDLWHAGTRVKPQGKEIISREEIERCIREVMEGERGDELRRSAAKWRELAREAVGEGGSSDKNIERFVKEVASL